MRTALLIAVLAAAACGAKEGEKTPEAQAQKPAAKTEAKPATNPGEKPPPAAQAEKPATPATGDACEQYREIVEKLAACSGDALPQPTRDAIKANFARDWASWDKLDGSDKARRDEICRSAVENIQLAAAEACGWVTDSRR